MNEVHAADALVGAWRLVSWQNQAADGQVTYPMGTDAMGYLLYGADGRFSVTISRKGRARFAASDLLSGTAEEKARALEGLSPTRAATPSTATASSIMWSCRCSPTGLAATRSGGSSLPGTG
jgi:hypothetical protein